MKYILTVVWALVLASCEEKSMFDEYAVSDQVRDSVYRKIEALYVDGKYLAAEQLLATLKPRDLHDFDYFSYGSNIRYKLGKYEEAIKYANVETFREHPARAYFLKALCFTALNMRDSAITPLNKAIRLDSTNVTYLGARVEYYLSEKLPILALDDAQQMVRIDSTNPTTHSYLSLCKFEFGDIPGAIKECELVLRKDPNSFSALRSLGYIFFKTNQKTKAKLYYGKCLGIKPNDGEILFRMFEINRSEKKYDKGCEYLHKAIDQGYQQAKEHSEDCESYFKKRGLKLLARADSVSK